MRYLIFPIFLAAWIAVIACARPAANASNQSATAENTVPAAAPANQTGATIVPIPTPPPNEEVPRIPLADAKKAFDDGSAYFVDARPAEAYNEEHIKGAINIIADKLDSHLKELRSKTKIIVYCS
jgi:hypothetical protein